MINLKESNHTNRELELMLQGKKPFAIFADDISCYPNEFIFPEAIFLPYVENNILIKDIFTIETSMFISTLNRNAINQYVAYALPNEIWRIEAYKQLDKIRNSHPPMYRDEGLERYECALLGYTFEETNAWIAHVTKLRSTIHQPAI